MKRRTKLLTIFLSIACVLVAGSSVLIYNCATKDSDSSKNNSDSEWTGNY